MARVFYVLVLFFLAQSVGSGRVLANEAETFKHALIIGVAVYRDEEVPPLFGVPNDMDSAREIATAMGIPTANITELFNEKATKANIIAELRKLSQNKTDGGRILIYFSGHGTRWRDGNSGGCVEGLLTWDREVIVNREFAQFARPLGLKADKLIIMFDACHSGGIAGIARNTRSISGEKLSPKFFLRADATGAACSKPSNVRTRSLIGPAQDGVEALPENVVHIMSARPDEVSFDEPSRGGLATQAVKRCLLGGAADTDASGGVSLAEVEECSQGFIREKVARFPDLLPHHISISGLRNLVPVAMQGGGTKPSAEAVRLEKERLKKERQDAEQRKRLEEEKIATQRAEQVKREQARIAEERARTEAEQVRLAAERAEAEKQREAAARLEAENQRLAAERAEQAKREQARLAEERARIEAEQARLAKERAEAEKQREAAARLEVEKQRLAAERAEKAKREQERLAQERARAEAEQARLAAERAEVERQRLAAERAEQVKRDQARVAEERARIEAEQARLAKERAEAEKQREAAARLEVEKQRLAAERAEKAKREQERLAQERARAEAEQARLAAERAEAERARLAALRLEAEKQRLVAERLEQTRLEQERLAAEAALAAAAQTAALNTVPNVVVAQEPIPVIAPVGPLAALKDIYAQRDTRRKVSVSMPRDTLRINQDMFTMTVTSSHAGFVYVLLLGSDETSFYMLFPNALDQTNRIEANKPMRLPRPHWAVNAAGPPGIDQLLVIVAETARDLSVLPSAVTSAENPFTLTPADIGGRRQLVDFVIGTGVSGASRFGASWTTVKEVQ